MMLMHSSKVRPSISLSSGMLDIQTTAGFDFHHVTCKPVL